MIWGAHTKGTASNSRMKDNTGKYVVRTGRDLFQSTTPAFSGVPRGWFGGFKPPRKFEDIGGVLDRMSKKNRRLDFLLYFTVFSYGCNLLNKGFF